MNLSCSVAFEPIIIAQISVLTLVNKERGSMIFLLIHLAAALDQEIKSIVNVICKSAEMYINRHFSDSYALFVIRSKTVGETFT